MRNPSKYAALKSLNLDVSTVVDVGAGTETLALKTLYPRATHWLFEPNTSLHPQLKANYDAAGIESVLIADPVTEADHARSRVDLVGSTLVKIDVDSEDDSGLMMEWEGVHSVSAMVVECTFKNIDRVFGNARVLGFQVYDIVDMGHASGWMHQFDAILVPKSVPRPPVVLDEWEEPWSLHVGD